VSLIILYRVSALVKGFLSRFLDNPIWRLLANQCRNPIEAFNLLKRARVVSAEHKRQLFFEAYSGVADNAGVVASYVATAFVAE